MQCYFCDSLSIADVKAPLVDSGPQSYLCRKCGHVFLDPDTALSSKIKSFTENQKKIISIYIRNEYERSDRRAFVKALNLQNLDQIIKQYRPLDPLDKMDNVLKNLERSSEHTGSTIDLNPEFDFPYYHCYNRDELNSMLLLLGQDSFISHNPGRPTSHLRLARKGYQRLRELRKHKDSRQCFAAMWLTSELNHVYENAIKLAIEYNEEGQAEPRFKALRIDNKEHTNDINDEIIAEIRRSRFMVCDLTGYRGGVYWEAGFAYGLGLEVIYICRKDWIKPEILKDDNGKDIKELLDSKGKRIEIKKEGIHFDLEHRNRIEWEEADLEGFKDRLTKRIKAVII